MQSACLKQNSRHAYGWNWRCHFMRRISFHLGRQRNSPVLTATNCHSSWRVAESSGTTGKRNLKKIFSMHVVSDTSPLSCLASIQRLDLLTKQFDTVFVPSAVRLEAMRHPDPLARVSLEEAFSVGRIVEDSATELRPLVALLKRTLDQGESEAISLAVNR